MPALHSERTVLTPLDLIGETLDQR